MEQSTDNQTGHGVTRRAFLKQIAALTGASVGVTLLAACGAARATATAVPVVQQPTFLPTAGIAPTIAATTGAASMATSGTALTGAATAGATTPAAGAPTTAGTSQDATPTIVAATNTFLATLSDAEKSTGLFDWTNTAQKQRWSNFPAGAFKRAGLMWGNLSQAQQNAWLPVMQATLSTEGYNRVLAEWNADEALLAQDGTGGGFGKNNYYIAIIGTPSETAAWQWQFGGHHLGVNATIVGPNLSLTPSFIGVQPGSYTDANGKTVVPLGDIDDDAFALINVLDATQQKAAILGGTVIDLVLGPGQDGKTIQSEGLPASQMNADQQAAFMKVISHYTGLANDEDGAARTAEIKAALDQTYLAWYGPTTAGSAAYFRVTGPTIVIEYSPQGDPQGDKTPTTMHIHGIYRDPTNDYGAKYTGIVVG